MLYRILMAFRMLAVLAAWSAKAVRPQVIESEIHSANKSRGCVWKKCTNSTDHSVRYVGEPKDDCVADAQAKGYGVVQAPEIYTKETHKTGTTVVVNPKDAPQSVYPHGKGKDYFFNSHTAYEKCYDFGDTGAFAKEMNAELEECSKGQYPDLQCTRYTSVTQAGCSWKKCTKVECKSSSHSGCSQVRYVGMPREDCLDEAQRKGYGKTQMKTKKEPDEGPVIVVNPLAKDTKAQGRGKDFFFNEEKAYTTCYNFDAIGVWKEEDGVLPLCENPEGDEFRCTSLRSRATSRMMLLSAPLCIILLLASCWREDYWTFS